MSNGWRLKKGNPEYERYIHSAAWRKIADARLKTDNHTCCVCGKKADEVHHLTYENFKNEKSDDLVSLCRKCHEMAENFYDPSVIPWSMSLTSPNNFMAVMRSDAEAIAPLVFAYLKDARGSDFAALMELRQPDDAEGKKYWRVLKKAVNALCRKRYSLNCAEDRCSMMLETLTNHIEVICMAEIEHFIRNKIQKSLHEIVDTDYLIFGKWKAVGAELCIGNGTLQTLRRDDGTSAGPSLRETVLYYCTLDAAAGIHPMPGFECLTESDYKKLNAMADYIIAVCKEGGV